MQQPEKMNITRLQRYANSEEQAVPYSPLISWGHGVARLGGLSQKVKWLWREERGVFLRLATSAHGVYITVLLGLSSIKTQAPEFLL